MKILVTGAGAVLGQGIIKSLRIASHSYEIVAVDPDPRAVGLYWADRAYQVPMASDREYGDVIDSLLQQERPDVLLVGTDVELMHFSLQKERIESSFHVCVIVSPPEVIRIADDKWLTYQFLFSNGFPYPESTLPGDLDDLMCRCTFPLIVKPRIGARAVGVHKVTNEQELRQSLAVVDNPIIQDYISSPEQEFTSGITLVEGRVKAVVTMRRDLKDGNTHRAYMQTDSPYNELLAAIATKLGGEGVINFQFRVADNVPKIFEINARFSGTTPFRAYAGYNEVDHLIQYYAKGIPVPTPVLSPVVVLRYLNEIVIQSEQVEQLARNKKTIRPSFGYPFSP